MATGTPGSHGDPQSIRAGEVLEHLRRLHDMTLLELARRAGVSRTTLNAKRAGSKSWTLADIELFAGVFGVPPAVFFFDSAAFWHWWSTVGRPS